MMIATFKRRLVSFSVAGLAAAVVVSAVACPPANADDHKQPPATASANSIGLKLIRIPAGEYRRGTEDFTKLRADHPYSGVHSDNHERPAHPVRITKPFELGIHEVSVGQFRQFVQATGYQTEAERSGKGPRIFDGDAKSEVDRFTPSAKHSWRDPGFEQTDDHPVTCVSWRDAMAFCKWLSEKEGRTYRLPTEAQWEYACRAGTASWYSCGNDPDAVYAHGNVADAALERAHAGLVSRQRSAGLDDAGDGSVYTAAVGSYRPNGWGLYDLHGNLWEWCQDKYDEQAYEQFGRTRGRREELTAVDPAGPETTPQHKYGDWRSIRGGSW